MANHDWNEDEWERCVEEQREIEELPPAAWWEWWIAATGHTEADAAFKLLVQLGCRQGEITRGAAELHRRSHSMRFSHPDLRRHLELMAKVVEGLARLRSTELVYLDRVAETATRLSEALDQHRKAAEPAVERLKREPEEVTKPLIAEVERIVRRDTGFPQDNHVAVMLTAVAVPLRSPDALRVARGRRKRRSSTHPPSQQALKKPRR
jgi:hypothetical protein